MPVGVFGVPLWAELAAAGLGGLQGALFAATIRERRIDVLGVMILGLAVALGGSLMRDVMLNQPPVVVWSSWYLVVAALAALLGMAVEPFLRHLDSVVLVLDAVVIGTFGAIGTSKALALGVGEVGALLIGIVGGVGGSIVRDLLLGRPVELLHVGSLFAVAAGAGSSALLVLDALGVPVMIAGPVCIAVTAAVRLGAVRFGWTFPEQRSLIRPRV
ncbi:MULTISPECIES: trimeric intracellular cation channel family protein [unclassified Rathayibacter]|uniref:trimeric intracellular cation channel family protein n=1 Tax=unclassified Rathayibacter TaxID=2609250 RepID=UPI000AC810F3|nr:MULTISPECIES: TRIC cation channel family protein [unclassified Rathayibacter]